MRRGERRREEKARGERKREEVVRRDKRDGRERGQLQLSSSWRLPIGNFLIKDKK